MPASFAEIFLEAMRYEHWLRFYFADDPEGVQDEDSQDAVIRVPAGFAERSRAEEPELVEMLDALQEKLISMETSRDAVFACLARLCHGMLGKNIEDELSTVHDLALCEFSKAIELRRAELAVKDDERSLPLQRQHLQFGKFGTPEDVTRMDGGHSLYH